MTELLDVNTEPVKTAQTEAPGTEPSSWMPLSDEQRNAAPDSVKALLEAKQWSAAEQIANGYMDLEKVLGKGDHIFKPESAEDADGWAKYWQQLGVPDDINGYEFEADEAVPFDEATLGKFKEFSKKINLNKEQAPALIKFQREIIKEAMAIEAQEKEEAVATAEAEKEIVRKALVQRCGGEVAYQNQIKDAREMADNLGIFQAAERLGISREPEFIGMLMDMAAKTTEGILTKDTPPASNTKTPQDELKEIMESDTFKNKFAPGRKEVMKRYMELNHIIANAGLAPKRIQGG